MVVAEVERFEGVGRGVIGLMRLWKCVEKCERKVGSGWRCKSETRWTRHAPRELKGMKK